MNWENENVCGSEHDVCVLIGDKVRSDARLRNEANKGG